MVEVLADQPTRVPQWNAAMDGEPDYETMFAGYVSAVDWPVAAVWPELMAANPQAKLILSTPQRRELVREFLRDHPRDPDCDRDQWPSRRGPWLEMVTRVVVDRSLGGRTDRDGVIAAFEANEAAARARAGGPGAGVLGRGRMGAALRVSRQAGPGDARIRAPTAKEEFFEHLRAGGRRC